MTRVLVIDDEAPIRLLCRVNLEAEGMSVLEASDGPSGLEAAASSMPDVILLDVMMPGLDGWAVAEALLESESTAEIPIIFLTARAEFRDRARGLDIGGVDYITKPFNPVELAPLVRALLDRIERGERDELRAEKLSDLRALMAETWPWAATAAASGISRAVIRFCGCPACAASSAAKSAVTTVAPWWPRKVPFWAPIPIRVQPGRSRLARWPGLAIQPRTIPRAVAALPLPHARFSPKSGPRAP